MDLADSPEQARFRQEVRAWLRANLPAGWGTPACRMPESLEERVAFAREWQRRLHAGGFAGLDWPREYGGRGAGVLESLIYGEEYARARAPDLILLAVGLHLVGPTLIAHGSEAQKSRFLAPILDGRDLWCQGFSEPGAGSDLAALRTRGEVCGDEIVVTGQKIWTSFAQAADCCMLVVRTDPGSSRHRGLSFLVVDMKSPGISVRPLREMTGEAWFNEVFFDGVRVPREHLVGELHRGWEVVITTLSVERGTSAQHARLEADVKRLIELARRTPRGGRRAADDPYIRQKLAAFVAEVRILRTTAYRNASRLESTGRPGPEGSTLKLACTELDQRVKDTALEILGASGLVPRGDPGAVDDGFWCYELLWSRAGTIYAGTSEIQRNILAQRVLGLPRE
ncbi:MAG: acyl-CoA dehydrogenase family protein [Myxococcota bacterium]